jgi:hypothetical protein
MQEWAARDRAIFGVAVTRNWRATCIESDFETI